VVATSTAAATVAAAFTASAAAAAAAAAASAATTLDREDSSISSPVSFSLFKREESVSTKFSAFTSRIEARSIFNSSLPIHSNLLGVLLSIVLTLSVSAAFLFPLEIDLGLNDEDTDTADAGDNNDRMEESKGDSAVGEAVEGESVGGDGGGDAASLLSYLARCFCFFFDPTGLPLFFFGLWSYSHHSPGSCCSLHLRRSVSEAFLFWCKCHNIVVVVVVIIIIITMIIIIIVIIVIIQLKK
jgi:hypothetical protein